MNGNEFLKRIRRVAKKNDIELLFEKRHGKGSHGTLRYGTNKTILKDRKKEIGPGLLDAMLKQLGLSRNDI